jgi:hypothetical protein
MQDLKRFYRTSRDKVTDWVTFIPELNRSSPQEFMGTGITTDTVTVVGSNSTEADAPRPQPTLLSSRSASSLAAVLLAPGITAFRAPS